MQAEAPSIFPQHGAEWRAVREAHGLGVEQLARRAGVSRLTVWHVEADRSTSTRVRRLLAYALGLAAPDPTLWEDR